MDWVTKHTQANESHSNFERSECLTVYLFSQLAILVSAATLSMEEQVERV